MEWKVEPLRRLLAIVSALVSLAVLAGSLRAQEGGDGPLVCIPTVVANVNVRERPGLDAAILTQIPPGRAVWGTRFDASGEWIQVIVDDEVGWVFSSLLACRELPPSPTATATMTPFLTPTPSVTPTSTPTPEPTRIPSLILPAPQDRGLDTPAVSTPLLLTRKISLADLGYDRDDTVHGVRVTRDYTLNWPDAWVVRPGNTFTLRFSHSPALDPRSSLTVEFNGVRLGSVLLTPENADNGRLQVTIPAYLIRTGYNRLRLEFYMGLYDFNCRDLDDPAVWTTVHSSSSFLFNYSLRIPEPDLADFPVPFIDNSELVENHITFILPDQPTPAELNAATAIAAKLGQLAAWRPVRLHVLSESRAQGLKAARGDVILVGRADRLQILRAMAPPFLVWENDRPVLVDRAGQPLPPEAGVLWEQPSPIEETTVMLFVTGATDEAVLTAGRALASEASYPRLTGSLSIVLEVPKPSPTEMRIGQVISLEELGYKDRTAWGTREQSIRYTIPLPLRWQIRSEATFELHFAHSTIIDPERSSLSVLLNGTPVGSLLLTPENAEDGRATLRLPARLFRPGNNTLTVVSDMDFQEERRAEPFDCLAPVPKKAWLVVYADSQLNLPGGPGGAALDLADYPQAFIGPANLADLVFVVPERIEIAVVEVVLRIAERLGHFAEGESLWPAVVDVKTFESANSLPDHRILVGRPSQNAAIARLNDRLPQPFEPGTDKPIPVESLIQTIPLKGTMGYIQAVLSPEGKPHLIVTGTSDEGLLWAGEALSDPELMNKLRGDLVVLGARRAIATATVHPEEVRRPPLPPTVVQPQPPTPRPATWVNWLAIGLFLFTFAILALVVWPEARQRWKAREGHGA